MRFDLSEDEALLSEAVARALSHAGEDDAERDRRLFETGVGDAIDGASWDGSAPTLLALALAAEAIGRSLAPWTSLRAAIGAWVLRRSEIQPKGLARALAEGHEEIVFALGHGPARRVEGRAGRAHILWQDGSLLALYPPGSATLDDDPRADRSRPSFLLHEPAGPSLGQTRGVDAVRDALRILRAADAFGAASVALEMTCDYVRVRRQFGQPIGAFQAVRHQLADLAQDLVPCRFLVWRAAHLWNQPGGDRQTALAKAHVCDVAVATTRATVELHGAIGFTEAYPLQAFVKRAAENRSRDGDAAGLREHAAILAGW